MRTDPIYSYIWIFSSNGLGVVFYPVLSPYAEHVTYAFGMRIHKCSFGTRSLITILFTNDQLIRERSSCLKIEQ